MGGDFLWSADGRPVDLSTAMSRAGYWLEEQIGVGGMAVVFRARDVHLDRPVALKIIAPDLAANEEFRRRFEREKMASAAVDHPHIIPVFAAGNVDGILFIAMRYVPGGSASALLSQEGPLSNTRAAMFVYSVASALDAAHAAGLVHRDVKPSNILVDTTQRQSEHVYLSDFGLSRRIASSEKLTQSRQILATFDYASPEQLAGMDVDGATDQYSLACSAFELLTGRTPFPRDNISALILAHTYDPPPALSSFRRDAPPAADLVFAKALAKAPRDRFTSCGEFASALREALSTEPFRPSRGTRADARVWPNDYHPPTELARPISSIHPPTAHADWQSTATAVGHDGTAKPAADSRSGFRKPALGDQIPANRSATRRHAPGSSQDRMESTRTAASLPGVRGDSLIDRPEVPVREPMLEAPGASSGTSKSGSRLWPLFAGLGIAATAGIVAAVIFTGQSPNQPAAGTLLWSVNTGPYISAPTVANGAVYVGGVNGKAAELTEIDRSTGKPLWTRAVSGGAINAAPTVNNGIVYASNDSSVYAFKADDGGLRWVRSLGGDLDGRPTVADGMVFVTSFANTVYAIDAVDGSLLWKYAAGAVPTTTGSLIQPSITVAGGIAYVGANNGNAYALDATNGHRVWTRYIGAAVESTPAVAHGLVYFADEYDRNIYALDAATGSIRWQRTLGSVLATDGTTSSPVVTGGVVYVGGFDGNIYAFDAATGDIRWTYSTGYAIDSTPVVMGHTLYTGCAGGVIYALNTLNGKPRWIFNVSGDVDSEASVSNGVVYVDSQDSSDENTTLSAIRSP